MGELGSRLGGDAALVAAAEAALRVGVMWDTQVKPTSHSLLTPCLPVTPC